MLVAAVAAFTDVRYGKVYNWLTAPALALGLTINGLTMGVPGLLLALKGVGVAVLVLLALSVIGRLMGGGDAKLLMAAGSLLGPGLLLKSFAYGAIVGGIIALVLMACRGRLVREMAALGRAVAVRVWGQTRLDVYASDSLRLPYAVPLACGIFLAAVSQWGGLPLW